MFGQIKKLQRSFTSYFGFNLFNKFKCFEKKNWKKVEKKIQKKVEKKILKKVEKKINVTKECWMKVAKFNKRTSYIFI